MKHTVEIPDGKYCVRFSLNDSDDKPCPFFCAFSSPGGEVPMCNLTGEELQESLEGEATVYLKTANCPAGDGQ